MADTNETDFEKAWANQQKPAVVESDFEKAWAGQAKPPEPTHGADPYNTTLSPADEAAYQTWAKANHRERDTEDYDMRGAWKEGAGQAANGHFPDTYKKPNHPTFSDESKYATPDARHWDGDRFVAGAANLKNRTPDELRAYFAEQEPGVELVLPYEDTREPADHTSALDATAKEQALQRYHEAVKNAAMEDKVPEDEAQREADEAVASVKYGAHEKDFVGGPEDYEAATRGLDSVGKAATRVLSRRPREVPVLEPGFAQRDEAAHQMERSYRAATGVETAKGVWKGDDTPKNADEVVDKPWVRDATDVGAVLLGPSIWYANAVSDKAAELFGRDLPDDAPKPHEAGDLEKAAMLAVAGRGDEARDVVIGRVSKDLFAAATDPDLAEAATLAGFGTDQEATQAAQAHAASGLARSAGLMNAVAWAARQVSNGKEDTGTLATIAQAGDDVTAHDRADDALTIAYEKGDRSAFDALGWRDLPGRLRNAEAPDTARVIREAVSGSLKDDPAADEVRSSLGKGDAYQAAVVERMPLEALFKVQPDLKPTDDELKQAHIRRDALKPWRGTDEGRSLITLMGAAMVKPVGEDGAVQFVPSRLEELMRLAMVARQGAYEARIPMAGFGAPLAAALTIGSGGGLVDFWHALRDLQIPTPAGLDYMVQTGSFDAPMHNWGLGGSHEYAPRDDIDSTWLSRFATSMTLPERQGLKWDEIAERAGADPDSGATKAIGDAALATDFLFPAEEIAILPAIHSAAMVGRGAAAGRAGLDAGLSGRDLVRATLRGAAPVLGTGRDGIETVSKTIADTTRAGFETGKLNPNAIPRNMRDSMVRVYENIGVKDADQVADRIIEALRDRHAAILDTNASFGAEGGPAVQRLRGSVPYMDRSRELDEFVRAGQMSPQERDLALRYLEALGLAATERGTVASPEEFFARHSWGRGVEADLAREPAGTLHAGDIPKPTVPEPSTETMRARRKIANRWLFAPDGPEKEAAKAELDAFYEANPSVKAWRDYQTAVADAEMQEARAGREAEALQASKREEAGRAAKTARHEEAKRTGKPLPAAERAANRDAWFDGSVVTDTGDAEGKPLLVTHETSAKFNEFRAGEFGFHFGADIPPGMFGSRSVSGHLRIENPYRMRDLGVWTPENVIKEGPFGREEQAALLAEVEKARSVNDAPTKAMVDAARAKGDVATAERWQEMLDDNSDAALFRDRRGNYVASKPVHDALKAEGYDGIVYRNEAEGTADSYIAIDPTQFKSEKNIGTYDPNDPNILHSVENGKVAGSIERMPPRGGVPQIGTGPEFRRWFGDSKAVDESGNPRVLYHGTSGSGFDTFDAYGSNHGLFGQGIYLTEDPEIASSYTKKGRGESPGVYPLYASIKNPMDMDAAADIAAWQKTPLFERYSVDMDGAKTNEDVYRRVEQAMQYEEVPKYEAWQEIQDAIRAQGHDGITHVGGGRVRTDGPRHRVFIAFDPEQVKSAIGNVGEFDPNDANILHSREGETVHGSIEPHTDRVVTQEENPDRADWSRREEALANRVAAMERAEGVGPTPSPLDEHLEKSGPWWERRRELEGEVAEQTRKANEADPHRKWNQRRYALREDLKRLEKNPAPHDPEWLQETEDARKQLADHLKSEPPRKTATPDLDAARMALLEHQRTAPPVSKELADARRELEIMRAGNGPARTIRNIREVPGYILRLFRSATVSTAAHEATHLIDLMLGPEWTEGMARALGYSEEDIARFHIEAQAPEITPLVREIREAVAHVGERIFREKLRPGGRLANLLQDGKDALSDLWGQIRGVPGVAPREARARFDATFRPGDRTRPAAVALVDERFGRKMPAPVVASGVPEEEIAQGLPLKAGQSRYAASADRASAEVRAELGIVQGQTEIDPVELFSRTLAYVATERMRRKWGFGTLESLTSRTAVPVARARRVRAEVRAQIEATLGSMPRFDGDWVHLDADQQAGVSRLVAGVKESPLGGTLDMDPDDIPATMHADDWNSLNAHLLDVKAGAGAFRERRAAAAQEAGALSLVTLIGEKARTWRPTAEIANAMQDALVVSDPAAKYVGPAKREALAEIQRRLGNATQDVRSITLRAQRDLDTRRWWQKVLPGGPRVNDILRRAGSSMAPELVPVEHLAGLVATDHLQGAPTVQNVAESVNDLQRLFTASPTTSASQNAHEIVSLGAIDRVARRVRAQMERAPGMSPEGLIDIERTPRVDMDAAYEAAGITQKQAEEAMSIVMEGLRRRSLAVREVGEEILVAFAGSPDRSVLAGVSDPAVYEQLCRRAYAAWYSGDWTGILSETTRAAQAATGDLDQGTAALTVLLRLRVRQIMADFAKTIAKSGLAADTADLLQGGLDFDRPYTVGSVPDGHAAYVEKVAGYVRTICGWKAQSTVTKAIEEGGEIVKESAFHPALGANTFEGSFDAKAWADAERLVSQWGFKPGKGVDWDLMDLPGGSTVLVPTLLEKPFRETIERVAPSGMAWRAQGAKLGPVTSEARAVADAAWVDRITAVASALHPWRWSVGMLKTGLTTGIGPLVHAGFFVGNAFGGALQMHLGMGAYEGGRALLQNGPATCRVLARMWRDGEGILGFTAETPGKTGVLTAGGAWVSDRSIADGVIRAGLNSSLAKAETGRALIDDVARMEPTWKNLILSAPEWWQDTLREGATAIDNFYRVSAYVDAIRQGRTVEEAAEIGRRIGFDYNELTDWERTYARRAVLFYTYARRNQDLFWHTMLTHPSRVFGELSLMKGLQQKNLGDDSDLFVPGYDMDRLILSMRDPLVEGHFANAERGVMMVSPSIPLGAALGFWIDLLGLMHGEEKSAEHLAGQLNPVASTVYGLATGEDPRTGTPIDDYMVVPNSIVELDEQLTGGMLTKDILQARPAPETGDKQDYSGAEKWVARNGRAWYILRNNTAMGSGIDRFVEMQRADFGQSLGGHGVVQGLINATKTPDSPHQEPDAGMARTGLTENEELWKWWGLAPVIVDSHLTMMSKLHDAQMREIESRTKETEKTAEVR